MKKVSPEFDLIRARLGHALATALDGLSEKEIDEIEMGIGPLINYLTAHASNQNIGANMLHTTLAVLLALNSESRAELDARVERIGANLQVQAGILFDAKLLRAAEEIASERLH